MSMQKLAAPHHEIVVDYLVSALKSDRAHRQKSARSKGKTSRRRKRRSRATHQDSEAAPPVSEELSRASSPLKCVLVGFNRVNRHLEKLSAYSNPSSTLKTEQLHDSDVSGPSTAHVAVVFLLRPVDDPIHSHLPLLCHTASLAHPTRPATRLVLLDPSVEERIALAVCQSPRVSVVGILDTGADVPSIEPVIDHVRRNVDAVDVPWLQ